MSYPQAQVDRFRVVENPGDRDQQQDDEAFEARLIREVRKYYDLTKLSRARRYYLWTLADLFAKAIHYIDYSPQRGTIEEWSADRVSKCMYTPVPLLQYAIEVIAAQYTQSNSRSVPMPTDTSDPKVKAVVRSLQDYADYLDWEFYRRDPVERQTEAKLIPLRGVYNFLEYDRNAGPKIQLPQYQPQMASVCGDCGAQVGGQDGGVSSSDMRGSGGLYGGASSGAQSGREPESSTDAQDNGRAINGGQGAGVACQDCGSQNIQQITSGVQNAGNVLARQGAVKRNVVDSFQVEIYDRRRGVPDSKHLIYDEILFKTEAKKAYPWLKEVKGGAMLGNYEQGFLGLHYLNQLQVLLGNTGKLDQSQPDYINSLGASAFSSGYGGSVVNDLLCWRRRCWFDVEVYGDWVVNKRKATQLPGTDKLIPAGAMAGDIFPDGMCIHIINGDLVVQLENQDKDTVWSYVGYRVPSAGMHGTGVSSLIALVRGNDEAHSIGMQGLLMAALGIVLVDERVPNAENVPGRVLTVPIDANPLGQPLTSFGARLDMGGAAVIAAAEPIKEGLRGAIGDMSMAANPQGTGLRPKGVGEETATAVRYNAGATGTLTGPPMESYGAHRAVVITQAVALERKHNLRPRLYGKVGDTAAKWFQPMQIPEDIKFGSAEESWRPRTLETQREDVAGYIQLSAGIKDPQIDEKARRVFGLDDEVDGYDDWMVLGEKRLDALKAALPQLLQEAAQIQQELQGKPMPMQLNPATGQPAPVYDPAMSLIQKAQAAPRPMDMPGHLHYARFYNEKYQSDEWDSYHPILQQAIEKLFLMHQQGIGQAMAVQTEIQVEGQKPAMQAQQENQQAQAAAQDQRQGDTETRGRGEEEAGKQGDHGRSMQADELKHQRAKELQDWKHQHDLEIERIRSKNRGPAPSRQQPNKRKKRTGTDDHEIAKHILKAAGGNKRRARRLAAQIEQRAR